MDRNKRKKKKKIKRRNEKSKGLNAKEIKRRSKQKQTVVLHVEDSRAGNTSLVEALISRPEGVYCLDKKEDNNKRVDERKFVDFTLLSITEKQRREIIENNQVVVIEKDDPDPDIEKIDIDMTIPIRKLIDSVE